MDDKQICNIIQPPLKSEIIDHNFSDAAIINRAKNEAKAEMQDS